MGDIKTTELDYKNISEDIYDINDNSINKTVVKDRYKVLAVKDNKNNGMQSMAVAPEDSKGEIEVL